MRLVWGGIQHLHLDYSFSIYEEVLEIWNYEQDTEKTPHKTREWQIQDGHSIYNAQLSMWGSRPRLPVFLTL